MRSRWERSWKQKWSRGSPGQGTFLLNARDFVPVRGEGRAVRVPPVSVTSFPGANGGRRVAAPKMIVVTGQVWLLKPTYFCIPHPLNVI